MPRTSKPTRKKTRKAPAGGKKQKPDERRPRLATLVGSALVVLLVVMAGLAVFGWQWAATLQVQRLDVAATPHVPGDEVVELARIDSGTALFDIDPTLVADRVQRHPWVAEARVRRRPPGVVRIDIAERVPVALVLNSRGQPAHYLDRDGYQLPLVGADAFNVPLIQGLNEPDRPTQPIEHGAVRALLPVLADLDAQTDALISEILVMPTGGLRIYTTPIDERESIPVELGRRGFAEKLVRLKAFWYQAVLPQPEKTFTSIDLRFDSQIIAHND